MTPDGDARRDLDPAARARRLRWRARRGLLENDIVLQRFFEARGASLTEDDIAGLDALLDCTDNDLLDLVLGRKPLAGEIDTPSARRVLQWLQQV